MEFVKKCDKCQRYASLHHALAELLHFITTPWPFYQRGLDILFPFPLTPSRLKFLIIRMNYFTKWIKIKVVSKIRAKRVPHFYRHIIMWKFGFPDVIILDNRFLFSITSMVNFCNDIGVQTNFIFTIHPQANGKSESSNKVTLKGIKKKWDDTKVLWVEYLHKVLWSYHTTPHLTTKETHITLKYKETNMFPVKINMPSWQHS